MIKITFFMTMSIWKSKSTMKMAKSILRMSSSFKTGYETKKKT